MIDCEHPCACNCVAEANAALTAAGAERDAMSNVMGRMLGARFLDPPDGGDVPLPEQVRRVCEALLKAEWELKHWQDIAELNAQAGKELGERAEKAEAELATLMDPAALHINALRLLTPDQRLHLGGQAMQEAVAKAKAETKAVKASVESTLQLQRERHERLIAEARAADPRPHRQGAPPMSPELEQALKQAGPIYDTTELERLITDLEARLALAERTVQEQIRLLDESAKRNQQNWQDRERLIDLVYRVLAARLPQPPTTGEIREALLKGLGEPAS